MKLKILKMDSYDDWIEDRIDLMIDNEIKEYKLGKLFAKKNLIDTITNLEPPKKGSGVKKKQVNIGSMVGTSSSQ